MRKKTILIISGALITVILAAIGMISLVSNAINTASVSDSPTEFLNTVGSSLLLIILGAIYLIPMVVALRRGHPQAGPIIVINLLLGWTLIGWALVLAWAVGSFKKEVK